MRSFDEIYALAEGHHGRSGVEEKLSRPVSAKDLKSRTDAWWLGEMTKAVFQSGFSWKVIKAKWPGFEAAFDGFDPHKVAMYSDDDVARLTSDTRIVRNGAKIMATVANAQFVLDTAKEHGSFGEFLAGWPVSDQPGLLEHFKQHASRLSGSTGQYFLRFTGWDAWIASGDVVKALIREGVIDKPPTSKTALKKVQAAFDVWREQSGRSQTEISRILALSVGPSGEH